MRYFASGRSQPPHRTRVQRDANELDREAFNLIARLEELAERVDKKADEDQLQELARLLHSSRPAIRKHMHPDDVENTR